MAGGALFLAVPLGLLAATTALAGYAVPTTGRVLYGTFALAFVAAPMCAFRWSRATGDARWCSLLCAGLSLWIVDAMFVPLFPAM
jgi:hypothetical protein